MNDPEVIMLNAFPDSNLIAHRKAVEAAAIAMSLVVRVPAPLKCLANQVNRSASLRFQASSPGWAGGWARTAAQPR